MQGLKRDDFNSRRQAAEAAKKAMMERFRAQPRNRSELARRATDLRLALGGVFA